LLLVSLASVKEGRPSVTEGKAGRPANSKRKCRETESHHRDQPTTNSAEKQNKKNNGFQGWLADPRNDTTAASSRSSPASQRLPFSSRS
jgi:hypothetical protein